MKNKHHLIMAATIAAAFTTISQNASGQGCVAGRCPVGVPALHLAGAELDARPFSGWQASIGYRYLHSDRHFVGTAEQHERAEESSAVINDQNSIDLGLTYSFNPRWSVSLSVPWVDNDRSSPVYVTSGGVAVRDVHGLRTVAGRYNNHAEGLGDMRISLNYWLFEPGGAVPASATGKGAAPAAPSHRRGNVRVGIGLDLPTGQEDVMDYRWRYNESTGRLVKVATAQNVDQSIQPGDGGWGIPIDLYAYYNFTDRLSGYFQSSYLITPETKNGVTTGRSNPFEAEMSIGDTFMVRTGIEYAISPANGLTIGLGVRSEGQPDHDLFGKSNGFRRPGMNIAVEPSITWMKNGWSASLSVPITFYNERFQSVADRQFQAVNPTDPARHGDAAFADWYLMFSVGKQF